MLVRTAEGRRRLRTEVPVYTVAGAAHWLGVAPVTLLGWAQESDGIPLVTVLPGAPGARRVPFVGLVEAAVLAGACRAGLSAQQAHTAFAAVAPVLAVPHPLAHLSLHTDGPRVLTEMGRGLAEGLVTTSRKRRPVFVLAVQRHLEGICYASDGCARRMRLHGYGDVEVLVDAYREAGQPVLAEGRALVADIVRRFRAGDDIETLSRRFWASPDHIRDVVRTVDNQAA